MSVNYYTARQALSRADIRNFVGTGSFQLIFFYNNTYPKDENVNLKFLWDSTSTDDDDNAIVIKPTSILSTDPGRWIYQESAAGGAQVCADWTVSGTSAEILNKPTISTVGSTGNYSDLTGKPSLAAVATSGVYSDLSGKPTLSTVAASGSYNDLSDKPTIPPGQINTDWNSSSGLSQITNKPTLSAIATSGSYTDLSGKPSLSTIATSGSYTDLTGKPSLATVATSGAYTDLTGKPSLATVATTGAYTDLSGKPSLATVATTGSYGDLSGAPSIGKAYIGTTQKVDSFRIYKNATVSAGVAVFNLTDDGLSTGTALFSNEVYTDSVNVAVSDATASYQMSWVFSNSNKTLTVTANKLTTANILTGLLGQAAANGAVVKLVVEGR